VGAGDRGAADPLIDDAPPGAAGGARSELDTIPAVLAATAARHGDRAAVADGSAVRTWSEVEADAARFAAGCVAAGIAPGDAVAVWAPNGLPWIVAGFGALAAGARLVPLSTRSPAVEVAPLLARARARLLVVATGFLGATPVDDLRRAGHDGTGPPWGPGAGLRLVVDVGERVADGAVPLTDFVAGADARAIDEVARRRAALQPDDVSHVQFTSGTTGTPKGVLLRHGAMVATTRAWSEVVGLEAGDRYLVVSPCSHLAGHKTGVLACATVGATILPQAVFDPAAVLARIARDRVSVLQGPPTMFHALLDHPERTAHDLGSLRLAVTGAATIPVTLVHRLRDELGIDAVLTAYGLSETSGVCTMCRRTDAPDVVATTSGRPIPGVSVRIVDGDGSDVATGVDGEVLVHSTGLMAGYLDDPAATAAVVGADGWLHTGDIGRLDGAGNLAVTDRLKDLVIVGGFNVSPAEVEDALLDHAAVGAVAVVAGPDPRHGEVPVAFVVPAPGAAPQADELVAWCRERLAGYKVPRAVHVVDDLPLTTAGKVRKDELRARLRGPAVTTPGPARADGEAT
jgi:HIP---CoA ligase